ncbi:MAG: ribonuclease E/G, partial [Rhodobacteraceae bacterium]|nr:ribonuclease E/G [Paracoccaceae bacterium]
AEIHPDYYQIPVADRLSLLAEERAHARAQDDDEGEGRGQVRRRPEAAAADGDARAAAPASPPAPAPARAPAGMDVVEAGEGGTEAGTLYEPAEAPAPAEAEGARERPFRVLDHAADIDDEIESIADEDVSEEIGAARKPRPKRYKIQEVVKVRQIMLVQVLKEERGNKGAALTTYLSLAGRYCVLMPNTARGGGISRKITVAADRKKLKEIAADLDVPEGAGLIIRTAGARRTKAEIKRDYEYLQRLWELIRTRTLASHAPAPIYEEGNLIKRAIRDLYSREIDEVLVEGESGYRTAKDFMKMIMPSHAKNVKAHGEPMPLFARFQVESFLGAMFNPVVQLKSGGYIVIGVTEALVSIDVNSGRATREGSIEQTALNTNLEAAEEIARQLRLRDLAGLIVIDFIDMEERKNSAAVEKRLKEKLKTDRARIQVGRISGFGLLEMSRQRLRPGMLEATTRPCPHCHGTGLLRSDDSLALAILRQIEEEGTRKRTREVLLRAPVGIVNFLVNHKREHIGAIEARYGMAVRLEAEPALVSPNYALEKFKTATRRVAEPPPSVVTVDATLMPEPVEEEVEEEIDPAEDEREEAGEAVGQGGRREGAGEGAEGEGAGKRRRRRRRRRRGGPGGAPEGGGDRPTAEAAIGPDGSDGEEEDAAAGPPEAPAAVVEAEAAAPAAAAATAPAPATAGAATAADGEAAAEGSGAAAAKPRRTRAPRKPSTRTRKAAAAAEAPATDPATEPATAPPADPAATAAPGAEPVAEPAATAARAGATGARAGIPAAPAPEGPADTVPPPGAAEPPPAAPGEEALPPPASVAPRAAEGETGDGTPAEAPDAVPSEADPPRPPRRGWWSGRH